MEPVDIVMQGAAAAGLHVLSLLPSNNVRNKLKRNFIFLGQSALRGSFCDGGSDVPNVDCGQLVGGM